MADTADHAGPAHTHSARYRAGHPVGLLIGQGNMGIMRVSDTSGTPEVLIAPKSGEIHHGPQMLPDGDHVLFTLLGAAGTGGSIVVQSVASNERDVLITPGVDAKYIPTGHLDLRQSAGHCSPFPSMPLNGS